MTMRGPVAVWMLLVLAASPPGDAHGQPPGTTPRQAANQAQAQGKIVAMHGRVQHAPARSDAWDPARVFQPLYAAERVRTLVASRAAILFIDETQVKLNAGTVLTVEAVNRPAGSPTVFDLVSGEAWFRTKNPASGVRIRTPAAAAAIRGTEINVEVRQDDTTVLTVVEGSVEFSNPQGSLLVNAGEEATARPGQAPTKRIVLNPDDAVQWALYYPASIAWHDLPAAALAAPAAAGLDRLRAGDAAGAVAAFEPALATDVWSRIGASMAYVALGDLERAVAILAPEAAGSEAPGEAVIARHAQLAAVSLAAGDARAARREIEAALRLDRTALRPLALLASLELTQNRQDEAAAAAAAALAAHPDSVAAHVAAAETAQAAFDLARARRHLDRALSLDPEDIRALVDRARIRFGTGDTTGAQRDADRVVALAPDEAQGRSLLGFIRLAAGDVEGALRDFTVAAQADTEFGEPHLGLGLVHVRQGRLDDGLLEMLTATLIEPNVSLYQSYLGKTYYQLRRVPEGLSALETAKRLDPGDPTPWLYTSLFLRDQNRQVAALEELRRAIALNDHRAVYRSRLLLDRDLATKNVSLAEVYRQLGFEAWGAFEAQNSLDADVTNASAHLFLADTYGRLPDRSTALSSELFQYFLHAPVNRNSFHTFNEYTALIEQPTRQLSLSTETGSRSWVFGDAVSRSGNERFAHNAFVEVRREDGARAANADDRIQGFFQGKAAIGTASDLFVSVDSVRHERGVDFETVNVFGLTTPTPVLLRRFTEQRDPNVDNRFTTVEGHLGFRHGWRPGSAFTAAATYQRFESVEENLQDARSVCAPGMSILFQLLPLTSASGLTYPFHTYSLQVQQAARLGRHQLITGSQVFRRRKERRCEETITFDGEPFFEVDERTSGRDRTFSFYLRDEIQLTSWLHGTVGVQYQDVEYADFDAGAFTSRQWNPIVGLAARLTPTIVVRAAAFKNLNGELVAAKISPTTVAGFAVERNEFPTTERQEADLSLEAAFSRVFLGARAFVRETEVPLLQATGGFVPEADERSVGGGLYVNAVLAPRLTVFADDLFARADTAPFVRSDNQIRAGVNVIHERGLFARVAASHITQRFSDTTLTDLPEDAFDVVDLELGYEFAAKRGLLTLTVLNLFDERFTGIVEGLTVVPRRPERRAVLRFRWRL